MRQTHLTGSPFEQSIGFSRACKIGNQVAVAGTAPIGENGETVGEGDAYIQTKRCLEIMLNAAGALGAQAENAIRTRIMLTDISNWEEAARAHGEVFGNIKPVCTFVEVSGLINPLWLVETEMDCVLETE